MLKKTKAVSEIVSYVLLISITIMIAIGMYAYLKSYSNLNPVNDCDDQTSLIVTNYSIDSGNVIIQLKNNGYFNVDGFILSVGNETEPIYQLLAVNDLPRIYYGIFYFIPELKPGTMKIAYFKNKTKDSEIDVTKIHVIQIQPFILNKDKRVVCSKSVIQQEV